MAAITISSDFGAPQNKVWHCFHCFPIYFPWSDGTRCHDLRRLVADFYSLQTKKIPAGRLALGDWLGQCRVVWVRAKSLQLCPAFCDPVNGSPPGSSVMGFSTQEYWSGLPCPPPGDLPDPGIKPRSLVSPELVDGFFTTRATWEAHK